MQVCASSLPSSPPNETRTSPPIARSALISAATGLSPIAVVPPHSGVQPPPDTTNARLNCLTPVLAATLVRLNGGNRLVSTYGAKPAVVPAGWLGEGDGAGEVGDGDGLLLGVAVGVGVGAVADGLGVGEPVLPPPG